MMTWQPLINRIDQATQMASPTDVSTESSCVAPSVVCRVEQGSELLFEHASGWLDPENRTRPTTTESIFDYASLTKLFTATACLRLVDAGHLSLETPLPDILPEFGHSKVLGGAEDPITKQPLPINPQWLNDSGLNDSRLNDGGLNDGGPRWFDGAEVTIRRLLTHSGGLPAWRSVYRSCGPVPSSSSLMRNADQAQRARSGLSALAAYPLIYPPNQDYAYSDVGLMLLGAALTRCYYNDKKVTGADRNHAGSLADVISALVTKPLNLSAEFLPNDREQDRIAPTEICAWRGRRLHGEVHDENAAGIGGVSGHAGLFGTAADIACLGKLYLNGGSYVDGKQLLTTKLVQEATTEQFSSKGGERRGLGWMLRSEPNPSCSRLFSINSFGHTGYTGTSLWCEPERQLTVVLLTNRVYNGRDPQKIASFRPAIHQAISQIIG